MSLNPALNLESFAIEEAAPFAPWPGEMRRTIGANYREITFTFLYY